MDAQAFKDAMSQLAAAVTVVTTGTADAPHGTTVSAFMSLSLEPPMVLVSLDQRSSLLAQLEVGSPIGVNVLSTEQGGLARSFATRGIDRFAGVDWCMADGAPKLDGNHTWVAGTVARMIEAGDHVLVLVDVCCAEVNSNQPLLYWQREFGTHGSLDAVRGRAHEVEVEPKPVAES
ncbi:flavin reductase family protein [Corynebacterium sp. CNCTC7651]|uniref:flavin reductase family protein n=1 Tax=Corynebacterium sp. CNCTC7651 TaxID=2815361 RepID=UPI001F2B15AB|nr:flavin reductase family protein [Corynebacterium sp. CNCTC7651]UIZ91516.1 flavin reductase family protein [Corynebacterium sp. CNCTC7651]